MHGSAGTPQVWNLELPDQRSTYKITEPGNGRQMSHLGENRAGEQGSFGTTVGLHQRQELGKSFTESAKQAYTGRAVQAPDKNTKLACVDVGHGFGT